MAGAHKTRSSEIIRGYITKRMEQGALPSTINKELMDMDIDKDTVKQGFENEHHYNVCPHRITEDEILDPLARYLLSLFTHTTPDKKRLLEILKKRGWDQKDFRKACRKIGYSSATFKRLPRKKKRKS